MGNAGGRVNHLMGLCVAVSEDCAVMTPFLMICTPFFDHFIPFLGKIFPFFTAGTPTRLVVGVEA